MAIRAKGILATPAARVLLRVIGYYVVLIALGFLLRDVIPLSGGLVDYAALPIPGARPAPTVLADGATATDQTSLALTCVVAMLGAILLSVPVAWVYQLTRAKRGYQQSVVQLLIILPLVVAGIVVLVKFSLALAFSLAGIVAAVRFRNTLDDSKDAVYVFLATGIGLASAVDIPVATVLSLMFNATILVLWYTDFANAPVELEGSIAARRLERARELASTGTFVAQMDHEVLRNMTREQLEGVAERAWRRAHDEGFDTGAVEAVQERRLLVKTRDVARLRRIFEPLLEDHAKSWRVAGVTTNGDGIHVIEYFVQTGKKSQPDDILLLLRTACGPEVVEAELG